MGPPMVEERPMSEEKALSSGNSETKGSDAASVADKEPQANGGYFRVFTYGGTTDYILESIGILAAVGSGIALAMVQLVMGNFLNVLSDFSTGKVPDNFMSEVSKHALYFVYIGVARFVCTYIYATLMTYVGLNITRNIRYHYLRSALSQEIGFFDQGTAGSISMQATSNGKLIQSGITEKAGQVIQAVSTFVASFVIAFTSQWKLTLILTCVIPAMLLITGIAGTIDAGIETKILRINAQAASFAESVLGNIRATHAFDLGPRMTVWYGEYLDQSLELGNKKSLLYAVLFSTEYFVIFAAMGLAFWQGISMIARGEVDNIGTVFTVLFSVIIAAAMVNSIAPHMVTFGRAATAAGELFSLIDRESEINPLDDSGLKPQSTNGTIKISNISFSYPTRPDIRVLDNFSLNVPAGKVTALVGASGSGKSTIIGLLERWYNPLSGTITLDGIPITDLNLRWLRTNVRLVQQEPVLFNGTVFENISHGLVGTPWESDSMEEKLRRVKTAAKIAFADEFIESLPQGYDTRIGERGGLLSGGQKQRVAIARSVISEPKILLLDEATSALDPHAEGIVQKALDEASKNRTLIVIAHKLKTIRGADNIVVMKHGSIVEQGQHDKLVAAGGAYAKLVLAQDLSPQGKASAGSEGLDDSDGSETDKDEDLLPVQSLGRRPTGASENLAALKNREDYTRVSDTGLVHTVTKLVKYTPQLNIWYILSIAACIVGAGVYPGQALLLGNIMDVISADNMQERGNFIALMFFVMALGLLVVFAITGWSTNVISQSFAHVIRKDAFSAIIRQDLRFFDRPENTVGALTSGIDSDAQAIFELMGFSIAVIAIAIVTAIAGSIMAIAVSWKLGLVGVFAGIPPMLLAGYVRIRTETKMDAEIDKKFSKSASVASETVLAIRTVSSLAIEEDVLRRYTAELDAARRGSRRPLFSMMISFAMTQSIEYFVLALGFWYGSKLMSDGEISFYQFIVSFMSVYFSGQGCGQMVSFASSFTKANSAANHFFWLQGLEPTIRETPENKQVTARKNCDEYEFQNVHFSYPLAPKVPVLKGISLKIEPGQFVAFVGASGCGKSTMIALLERFYDPVSGSIIIDGTGDLSSINPSTYRSLVSLVQQEPTLFPGSIRDNIAMGLLSEPDDASIESACRAANVWDFVSSLPDGLATPCGSSGSQLSGGQRQRIAIARALIRNPRVILLDEATSALDTESERIVQGALMDAATTGNRVTVAVAHRLSTIRQADRIFVFFGGKIAEAGSHEELIAQGGLYKKMCEAQSLDAAV